jgi:hypothetical protein
VISFTVIRPPNKWSTGTLEYWSSDRKTPALHYSITPIVNC